MTAALATITFGAIIIAGSKAHGALQHWKNIVPHGLAWPIYILLIPIEIMGMFVRPFARPGEPGTEISRRRTLARYPVKALSAISGQAWTRLGNLDLSSFR